MYLLIRSLKLAGTQPVGADVCSLVLGSGCDLTLIAPRAYVLGFALAGWGMVYFSALAFLLALGTDRFIVCAQGIAAVGTGASVFLSTMLLTGQSSLCIVCLLVHAINFCVFASICEFRKSVAIDADTGNTPTDVKTLGWFTLTLCVAGAIMQAVFWWMPVSIDRESVLATYHKEKKHNIPINADDPHTGSEISQVQLIVFSSFQCPGCRNFTRHLNYLDDRFGNQLQIVFKHFPLGTECNPATKVNYQPHSCAAARAAVAASRQGVFRIFHDHLFQQDLRDKAALHNIANRVALDMPRWQSDRNSESTTEKVRSDIALGILLGVDETPSIFLNGRRIRPFSLPVLQFLIEHEIQAGDRDDFKRGADVY